MTHTTLHHWAYGPYGPGCGEPAWRCKACGDWTEDPRSDLAACPACGFSGPDQPADIDPFPLGSIPGDVVPSLSERLLDFSVQAIRLKTCRAKTRQARIELMRSEWVAIRARIPTSPRVDAVDRWLMAPIADVADIRNLVKVLGNMATWLEGWETATGNCTCFEGEITYPSYGAKPGHSMLFVDVPDRAAEAVTQGETIIVRIRPEDHGA